MVGSQTEIWKYRLGGVWQVESVLGPNRPGGGDRRLHFKLQSSSSSRSSSEDVTDGLSVTDGIS